MLWGDFPWAQAPRKVGKLLSMGVVARNVTRALRMLGPVVPYVPPPRDASPNAHQESLAAFLRSIDLLWADVYPASAEAIRLRRALGLTCPAILFAGGAMPKGAEAMLFPWQELLTSADTLVFTCEADRAIWQRLVKSSRLGERVISLAVDEATFSPLSPRARASIRARHGLPIAAPLLLYVGRFNIQKNLHTLLRLFAVVRQAVPDAHLCLIGEEDDIVLGEFAVSNTGYLTWLRSLAAELGVDAHVTFQAPRYGQDLAQLYGAADVLVNASIYHRENFGLSPAEAQACGVPVVCTDWGGFKDVVRHGETGYLMETVLTKHGVRVDWFSGAAHVVALLQNPSLRRRLGEQAVSLARQTFSIAALAANLAELIGDATRRRREYVPDAVPEKTYEPSPFARRYEAHKRACGWYADAGRSDSQESDGTPDWFTPMFQGRDYALYETLLRPYASRLAAELSVRAIRPDWVPYFPTEVTCDPVRRLVTDRDPIWPHRRFVSALEFALLQRIDGTRAVGELGGSIPGNGPDVAAEAVASALWHLHRDGFLLFARAEPREPGIRS